jgi:hypothetical protein
MKTVNYALELMTPGFANKDLLFNDSIQKIDHFLNNTVEDFTDKLPYDIAYGKKYIFSGDGANKNYVYYSVSDGRNIQTMKPYKDMLVFVVAKKSFYIFENDAWMQVSSSTSSLGNSGAVSGVQEANVLPKNFTGIGGEHGINDQARVQYLYISNNVLIHLTEKSPAFVTLIIKQNHQKAHSIKWSANILWPNRTPPQLTATPNAIDIISFYKMVETSHFVGVINGQNYQYA